MTSLSELASRLKTEGLALIASKGTDIVESRESGIFRVLRLIDERPFVLDGALVADKIVGKAAALLFIKAKVRGIYALTLSSPALECLNKQGLYIEYDTLVTNIKNRSETDICPMEKAVIDIEDPSRAYTVLTEAVKAMKNKK